MSNKSWSKLPSRGGNGCRGWRNRSGTLVFVILPSTDYARWLVILHPVGQVKWRENVNTPLVTASVYLTIACGGTRANQHPAKCSVIGCVYSVLAWFHAWLDCRIPFEENGLPLFVHEIVCTWVGQICIFRAVCMCGTGVRCHKGCQMRKYKSFVCNHGGFSPQSNLKTGHRL